MPTQVASSSAVRRWGAGTAAAARLLIATNEPLTGVAIAQAVGVTQPRVSQIIKQLTGHEAVRATEAGYVGRRARLLELYRQRTRPHLVEPESYWYSTRPAAQQAEQILGAAQDTGSALAFSADLATDLLVPWRHPTLTVVYAADRLVLEPAGLVPAEGRADASIILRWTRDPTLLSPAPPWPPEVEGVPVVDPVQQWWDLLDLGGEDRREAADRLRSAILNRSLVRPAP